MKFLKEEAVEDLLALRGRLKKLHVEERKLATELRKQLEKGYDSPPTLAWLLILEYNKSRINWEKRYLSLVVKYKYDGDWKAGLKHMADVERKAVRKVTAKIKVKPNPVYKRRAA